MKTTKTPLQIRRTELLREAMDALRDGADCQGVEVSIYQDFALIELMGDDAKRASVALGIVRFCEHALGYSRQ